MATRLLFTFATLFLVIACKVSQPGSVESGVVRELKKNITIGGKDDQNPAPDKQATIDEGRAHFGHHCQICHGLDGQNTGVPFAQQMSPPVADLNSKSVQAYSDGQLHWILMNGIKPSGMPSWKGILEDDEMWKIVRYLRHLPAKGSLGIPDVFKEDEREHQQMKSSSAHQQHRGSEAGTLHKH